MRYYHTNGLDELCDLKSDPSELINPTRMRGTVKSVRDCNNGWMNE